MARRPAQRPARRAGNAESERQRRPADRQRISLVPPLPSQEPETFEDLLRELAAALRHSPPEHPAEVRAQELFESVLTPEQHREYVEQRSIHVTAPSGRRYRIDCTHTVGNVTQVDQSGRIIESICAAPVGCPLGDKLLAQLLWLKYDEQEFRCRANINQYEHPRRAFRRRHRGVDERINLW